MNKGISKLKEYQEKVKSGEIERTQSLNPIEKANSNPKSLRLAINAKCYDCVCYIKKEITRCEIKNCPLWNVRPYQNNQETE